MSAQQDTGTEYSYEEIVKAICKGLRENNPEDIELTEETDMTTDLNVDSVAVMDLMFQLEEHFDISIPLNALIDVYTIGELAKLIQAQRPTK